MMMEMVTPTGLFGKTESASIPVGGTFELFSYNNHVYFSYEAIISEKKIITVNLRKKR